MGPMEMVQRLGPWDCLQDRKQWHLWNRAVTLRQLISIPVDSALLQRKRLHGFTLDDLIGFIPNGVNHSTAPFIHDWLKTGVEDLNQLWCAVQYLGAQIRLELDPDNAARQYELRRTRIAWQKTVRLNALLVREAKKLTYKNLRSHADEDTSCDAPLVKYRKDVDGNRKPAEPFEMYFFQNKVKSLVTGYVSKGAQICNIPYINEFNRLMVRENGVWVELDGDWSPVSVDITPEGTYKHADPPLWYDPSYGQIAKLLGRETYQKLCNSVLGGDDSEYESWSEFVSKAQ